jgi:flagellar basal body-associated protein FliL
MPTKLNSNKLSDKPSEPIQTMKKTRVLEKSSSNEDSKLEIQEENFQVKNSIISTMSLFQKDVLRTQVDKDRHRS